MKYTYPNAFDMNRAQELGQLVAVAYDQFNQGGNQLPAGYQLLAPLTAREVWKVPVQLFDVLGHLIPPVSFGFVASLNNDVYVVIRGTQTPLEWLDDFTVRPMPFVVNGQVWGNTTRGFKLLYDDLGPQIDQALAAFQAGGGSLNSVFVTGHSLGAALAHLAAAGINTQFGARPTSYTFCGPRAGDPPFVAAFEAAGLQTWRIFNTEDIVPTVPPAAVQLLSPDMLPHQIPVIAQSVIRLVQISPIGYQHIGYPIAATFHTDTIAGNHSLGALCQEIAL